MSGPDGVITLSDGRRLAYVDTGARDGLPVFSCHGGLSSRLDIAPAGKTATELGVRIISADRPGVGGSDPQPGRTVLDWPTDVAALADHLGVGRFAVLGWSAGGTYAMACAAALPGRVTRLGLVASVVPPDWPGMKREINRMDRSFMALSHAGAPIERGVFAMMRAYAHRSPAAFARRSGAPADVAAQVGAALTQGLVDTSGVVHEYRLLDRPWGFDPSSITVATHVWQGTADALVPERWGSRLAAAIPGAELIVVEGATHFLWYGRWADILGRLTGP